MTNKRGGLWLSGILLLSLTAYLPVLQNQFTNWDDPGYVLQNPAIRSLSFETVKQAFSGFSNSHYHPLTTLSLALDYQLSGLSPFGYHFTSLFLHLVNIVLVFFFVRALSRENSIAVVTAALFGVHTLHVETVAWVSERKGLVFAMFFLAALIFYVRYVRTFRPVNIGAALTLFLFSLLCKGLALFLTPTLFAVDWLLGRKLLDKRVWLEKLPFIAVSLVFGVLAVLGQKSGGTMAATEPLTLLQRLLLPGFILTQYVARTALPLGLSAFYPYPVLNQGSLPPVFYLTPLAVVFLGSFLIWTVRRARPLAFGLLFFSINIVLLLKVVTFGSSLMADRYMYIPSIGLFFLVAAAATKSLKTEGTVRVARGLFIVYLAVLALLTFERCQVWRTSRTLWDDVLAKNAFVPVAWNNRAIAKSDSGDFAGAIADYDRAITLLPQSAELYSNRGIARVKSGDFDAAVRDLSTAIELSDDSFLTYYNRGLAYANAGQLQSALTDFLRAAELRPDFAETFSMLGLTHLRLGDLAGAIKAFDKAITLDPGQAAAFCNRGAVKAQLNRHHEAIADFEQALRLDPAYADAYTNRGLSRSSLNDLAGALQDFSQAISLRPAAGRSYYLRAEARKRLDPAADVCDDLQQARDLGFMPAAAEMIERCAEKKE